MCRLPIGTIVVLVSLALAAASCGGGGGGGGSVVDPSLTVSFTGSGTASAPDMVRLTGSPSGEQVTVNVVLAGPTTSDDIASFAFDLAVGDPSVLTFVDSSAVVGPALTTSGCLDPVVLAEQAVDRVVVGVTKLGCDGNGLPAGEERVVSVTFAVLRAGTSTLTLEGSPPIGQGSPGDPAAFDSDANRIDSIQFDALAATVRGM